MPHLPDECETLMPSASCDTSVEQACQLAHLSESPWQPGFATTLTGHLHRQKPPSFRGPAEHLLICPYVPCRALLRVGCSYRGSCPCHEPLSPPFALVHVVPAHACKSIRHLHILTVATRFSAVKLTTCSSLSWAGGPAHGSPMQSRRSLAPPSGSSHPRSIVTNDTGCRCCMRKCLAADPGVPEPDTLLTCLTRPFYPEATVWRMACNNPSARADAAFTQCWLHLTGSN